MKGDFRISKPADCRYFPLNASEIAEHIAALDIKPRWGGYPITIWAENGALECTRGFQLCSFYRERYLAVFSLPEVVPHALARKAIALALERFAAIDHGPYLSVNDQQFVVYRAYLGSLGELTITQHVVNGISRSYLRADNARRLSRTQPSPKAEKDLFRLKLS